MKLYNVLSQRLEDFAPQGDVATIYVCGITPYDTTHLGHAFTYASFDVLIRYLEYKGYPVRYVQNVTDIDDDILRKAKEVDQDWQGLGNRWTAHFIQDMKTLNVRPPDYFPRATDVISEMIEVVQQLLEKGCAYEADGNVYFHIDSWEKYGQLSRIPRGEMLPVANERGNKPDDPHKRQPLDFVLWQSQSPGEPAWDSPWGPGRPGWHIECSTMATALLGDTIDIHGGGADLVFPHHESEIAQAECATGHGPFARFWLHTAMVHHDGEKMSKSLGNLVMARNLLETRTPDSLRLYMASHQYRQPWSYNEEALEQSEQLAGKLRAASMVAGGTNSSLDISSSENAFVEAMDDDLDTPLALITLENIAADILEAAQSGRQVQEAQKRLGELGRVFGLRLAADSPEERVINGWNEHLKRFNGQ